jgi:hypothetical protein
MLVNELANYVVVVDAATAASRKADDKPLHEKY